MTDIIVIVITFLVALAIGIGVGKVIFQRFLKKKELEAQEAYRKVYEVYLEMQDEFNRAVENYEEEREIDREKMIMRIEKRVELMVEKRHDKMLLVDTYPAK